MKINRTDWQAIILGAIVLTMIITYKMSYMEREYDQYLHRQDELYVCANCGDQVGIEDAYETKEGHICSACNKLENETEVCGCGRQVPSGELRMYKLGAMRVYQCDVCYGNQ